MTDNAMILVAGAAAIAAIASAIAAARTLKLAEREFEPLLIVYLDCAAKGGATYIVIENIGRGPAYSIKLEPNQELHTNTDSNTNRVPIRWGALSAGIPTLHPGRRQYIYWNHRRAVNHDLITSSHGIKVEYWTRSGLEKKESWRRETGAALKADMLPPMLDDDGDVSAAIAGCKRAIESLNETVARMDKA